MPVPSGSIPPGPSSSGPTSAFPRLRLRVPTGPLLELPWEKPLESWDPVAVGFREIRLRFELDSDAAEEQKKKLIELTERYCVVLQTLRRAPPVVTTEARAAD